MVKEAAVSAQRRGGVLGTRLCTASHPNQCQCLLIFITVSSRYVIGHKAKNDGRRQEHDIQHECIYGARSPDSANRQVAFFGLFCQPDALA